VPEVNLIDDLLGMGAPEPAPVVQPQPAAGGMDLLGSAPSNNNQLLEPSGGGTTDLLGAMMGGPGVAEQAPAQ